MWIWQWMRSRSKENAFGVPVRNFAKVDDRLYRGALPDLDGLRAMHDRLGVDTVINLVPGDRDHDRRAALEAGIDDWWHIGFSDREAPDPELVRTWLRAVRTSKSPHVYFHCKGGRHRTGMLAAVWRVLEHGWTKERAFEEMKVYGWYGALGHGPLKTWFFEEFDPDHYREDSRG